MKNELGRFFKPTQLLLSVFFLTLSTAQAAKPLWTFEPLTSTEVTVPANTTAVIQYRVTNQTNNPRALIMHAIPGVAQLTTGLNICQNPIVLADKGSSCILSLQVTASELNEAILDGPVLCSKGSSIQCYQPAKINTLHIKRGPPLLDAVITVTGSPLTLTGNGPTAQLTITNTSTQVAATNIQSDFTGTALDGKVTETGNTCANVPPLGTCTLTYTPGTTVVPQTNFSIQGSNTNALTAAIEIQSGSTLTSINPTVGAESGGVSFTLTGTGLTGATAVTFDGVAATNINVVNSTTVTGVTPAHVAGIVTVEIDTPAGGATLTDSFTYQGTTIGQSLGGGKVACLNGGQNNLIAATVDNSTSIAWGGSGIATGASSTSDGASNTSTIVTALGAGTYAARLCADYEIDSQGNTPTCQPGNECYNDWFLPAGGSSTASDQLYCLHINRAAIGGFLNGAYYWSSTEDGPNPANYVRVIRIDTGIYAGGAKATGLLRVRCVRSFTP